MSSKDATPTQEVIRMLWDALSAIIENPDSTIDASERTQALKAIERAREVFPDELSA